ncbi:MAG: hypothetical protein K6A65_07810 [Succinivibrionaceae bacterium]|nr:hypothetical protein [Succinivibrionaceae bacterium]
MPGIKQYKCPACGGMMEFDSRSQKMKCPFCDTEVEVEAMARAEAGAAGDGAADRHAGTEYSADESEGMETYACSSCGGAIVVTKETGASSCPFCGNPTIVRSKFEGQLRPDAIVPFKLDRKQLKERYYKHLEGKHFLPAPFRDENHLDEFKGVYVPFWLYSSRVHAEISYKCEQRHEYEDSDYRYIEHKYYDVFRKGRVGFEDVPADGSSAMADDLMESIEPFDISEGVEFATPYLAGYAANRYDQDEEACLPRVRERMEGSVREIFRDSIEGMDEIEEESSSFDFHKNSARYVLYPVWLMNTTWNGQRFTFAMNGQTGRFVGNLPMDKAAFWKAFFAWWAGLSVLFFILIAFYMMMEG